jgi:hypothetical protein
VKLVVVPTAALTVSLAFGAAGANTLLEFDAAVGLINDAQ